MLVFNGGTPIEMERWVWLVAVSPFNTYVALYGVSKTCQIHQGSHVGVCIGVPLVMENPT